MNRYVFLIALCMLPGALLNAQAPIAGHNQPPPEAGRESVLWKKGLFADPATKGAAAALAVKAAAAKAEYCAALQEARASLANTGDKAETAKIDAALKGKSVDDFTKPRTREAANEYSRRLLLALREFAPAALEISKKFEAAGRYGDAEYLRHYVYRINVSEAELPKNTLKPFTKRNLQVLADRDWQRLEVLIPPYTKVTVSASGTWAPGYKEAPGPSEGGPYVYPLQLRIGGERVMRLASDTTFIAWKGGTLEARMAPPGLNLKTLGTAKGKMTLTVMCDPRSRLPERIMNALLRDPDNKTGRKNSVK